MMKYCPKVSIIGDVAVSHYAPGVMEKINKKTHIKKLEIVKNKTTRHYCSDNTLYKLNKTIGKNKKKTKGLYKAIKKSLKGSSGNKHGRMNKLKKTVGYVKKMCRVIKTRRVVKASFRREIKKINRPYTGRINAHVRFHSTVGSIISRGVNRIVHKLCTRTNRRRGRGWISSI